MKNQIYLFINAVISVLFMIVSCADKEDASSYSKTGLVDQNGNIVSDTLIYTNIIRFTGNIPIWATNHKFNYSIISNGDNFEIQYPENVASPNLPNNPSDTYKIFVPCSGGDDYYTVNYKDTNRLKRLWFDQIFRKGESDGKVFAIRNKSNDKDANNFQSKINGRYDYYYFRDNGDIVWKGGNKNGNEKEIVIKRFVGAVIVDYRKVRYRTSQLEKKGKDTFYYTGEYTVGAIYKMAIDVNKARDMFCDPKWNTVKGPGDKEGVYNFIGIGKIVAVNRTSVALLTRQFYNTNFMEVLILNPYNNHGVKNCLGVQAYYAYYGSYDSKEGDSIVAGFTHENYPYMTDEKLYLGKRPEEIVPLLSYTTTFTENVYNWKFLAIPGHKY